MKQLACGFVIPGCDAVLEGESEQDVLAQVVEHARDVHGIDAVDADILERVHAAIRDV